MAAPLHVTLFTLVTLSHILSSSSPSSGGGHGLTRGSSLFVENKYDVLVSSNGLFTAGFHQVGENAYGFAVWFSDQATYGTRTIVWMANRDAPVNGKHSRLCLQEDGNLVLMDAGKHVIWSTNTKSTSPLATLQLHNTGNLVLDDGGGQSTTLWQSFDYPTDTLLPNQLFTKTTQLVSSRSSTNYSSGFYKLFFDYDSILRLLYDGPETTTIFWPDPQLRTWEAGRFQYQCNHRASLDSNGEFSSSDGFNFKSADFGSGPQRIMKIDTDGNVRVYSLVVHERKMNWEVQWQAHSQYCMIHGTCGPNSVCTYSQYSGRKCSCLYGYKMVKSEDWSYGCEPELQVCTQDDACDYIELHQVRFYGYDIRLLSDHSVDACKKICLKENTCMGFQFGRNEEKRANYCFLKNSLRNGYQIGSDVTSMYIKLPKRLVSSYHEKIITRSNLNCTLPMPTPIVRSYKKKHDIEQFGFMLTFGCAIGFIEIICIMFFWYYSSKGPSINEQCYYPPATGFRKFTYNELKKASCNFREEIGRGGACIVYKGKLSDNRIVAIKKLKITNHEGEAEFQAEINTIGRLNHMNLIETWGYCAEGEHRIVVYEYMENGSLAKNLDTGKLDWPTRLNIAKGTAKGLAYLHEECLEWVLHCDVKPHNILLDVNYNPKVADFGLSKLFNRGGFNRPHFSMIRGTRGYMAPEWVFNLPITSKVDVYSYGMVILEMITGINPIGKRHTRKGNDEIELVVTEWVRDKIQKFNGSQMESWVQEVVDPSVNGKYDITTMENLVRIALQCVEEDNNARPSMSQGAIQQHQSPLAENYNWYIRFNFQRDIYWNGSGSPANPGSIADQDTAAPPEVRPTETAAEPPEVLWLSSGRTTSDVGGVVGRWRAYRRRPKFLTLGFAKLDLRINVGCHLQPSCNMENTVTNTNNLSLHSILEKDKFTVTNFLDWELNVMIVLRHERKWYVQEEQLREAPPANATAAVRNAYQKLSDACYHSNGPMDTNAYDMICQLRDMFQTQACTERYDASRALNACKKAKRTSIKAHVIKMKTHIDHLKRLGHRVPLQLPTDMIHNSLLDDYKQFVINYNMNNMEKSIA
ncbi:hypothetical protein OSB04_024275 [Centaurea solstitialis]|uniref:non-specific serine/threonine protein kinase n=1 Tax=Centaurea solstitialis TaxID=347529 RepID=A0AA38T5A4_9ASTR|nr:hypothetical protein OSB04_024275 [Centaurea solstitialis]